MGWPDGGSAAEDGGRRPVGSDPVPAIGSCYGRIRRTKNIGTDAAVSRSGHRHQRKRSGLASRGAGTLPLQSGGAAQARVLHRGRPCSRWGRYDPWLSDSDLGPRAAPPESFGLGARGRRRGRGSAGGRLPVEVCVAGLQEIATPRRSTPGRFISAWVSGDAGFQWLDPADWLAVALTEGSELGELHVAQVFVPLSDITHRIVEPVLLMFRQGVDNTAAENVAEQLITCLGERGRLRGIADLLLTHAPSFWRIRYKCTRA